MQVYSGSSVFLSTFTGPVVNFPLSKNETHTLLERCQLENRVSSWSALWGEYSELVKNCLRILGM